MQKETIGIYKRFIRPLTRHHVFSLVILLCAMTVVFSIWSSLVGNSFFQVSTLKNVMNSLVITAFLTIGSGCLLMSGNLDLSAASVGAFGGMILAVSIEASILPWWVGIVMGLALCAVFGLLNGILVNVFRIPAFIATLAMASVARGLMLFVSSGSGDTARHVGFDNVYIKYLGKGEPIPGVSLGLIITIFFFIIYGVLISRSRFGLKVKLVGGNASAARLAGINPKTVNYILFINSAVLGGIAGMFNAARIGSGNLNALQSNQFTGLTAAILGGISFGGGLGGMGGAFVGLVILNTFQIAMTTVGVSPFWVTVLTGLLLLVALSIDFIGRQRNLKSDRMLSGEDYD